MTFAIEIEQDRNVAVYPHVRIEVDHLAIARTEDAIEKVSVEGRRRQIAVAGAGDRKVPVEGDFAHLHAELHLGMIDPSARHGILRHGDDQIERGFRRAAQDRMRGKQRGRKHAAIDREQNREGMRRLQSLNPEQLFKSREGRIRFKRLARRAPRINRRFLVCIAHCHT